MLGLVRAQLATRNQRYYGEVICSLIGQYFLQSHSEKKNFKLP